MKYSKSSRSSKIMISSRRCESMLGWNIRQQRDPQHSAHIRNPFHSSCTLYFHSNCTPFNVQWIHYIYTSTFCTVQNIHTLPIYSVLIILWHSSLYNTTSLSIKTLILHCSALFWIVKQTFLSWNSSVECIDPRQLPYGLTKNNRGEIQKKRESLLSIHF